MSKVLQRRTAILSVLASLGFATAALAQMPTSPWKKAAPFPKPDEELYGVAANGKMYVMGGWADGKAGGFNYEYDPATDKWVEKKSMPRPAHHAAMAVAERQDLRLRWLRAPTNTAVPLGAAWQPINDVWQYDPAADSWKSLAPMPTRRGSALAAEAGGKIYVIGGATTVDASKDSFFTAFGAGQGAHHQRSVRPRHQQVGEPHTDGGGAQSRVRRRRQRQDLRDRRPHRPRLHPDRHQHGCGGGVQSRERLVECSERADAVCPKRRGLGHGRQVDLCGGRRDNHQRPGRRV